MHDLRLPRLNIIAVDLHMANRLAEMRMHFTIDTDRAYRQQGNFIIEIDEAFDDDTSCIDATTGGGAIPCSFHIVNAVEFGLTFAG